MSNRMLRISSLLSLLLMTLHVTDDIHRGISPAGADNVGGVVIFLVWLVGTLLLNGRLGYLIMLIGGLFAAAMPVLHMRGMRYPAIATSGGAGGFFFVWTLFAVGTLGAFSFILAAVALWKSLQTRGPR